MWSRCDLPTTHATEGSIVIVIDTFLFFQIWATKTASKLCYGLVFHLIHRLNNASVNQANKPQNAYFLMS